MKWPLAPVAARAIRRTYCMHGVGIVVETAEPALISLLDQRLALFRLAPSQTEKATLRFEFLPATSGCEWVSSGVTHRTVYEAAGVEFGYSEARDQLLARAGNQPLGLCDLGRGEARFWLRDGSPEELEVHSQTLFTICLLEFMKRLGRPGLHAAGINIGGAGLLIAGQSGAGKSTLAVLALASLGIGAGFLGDDMLFLRSGVNGIEALGWPEPVDVSDFTLRTVRGLKPWVQTGKSKGRKVRVAAAEISGARPAFESTPAVVVMPRVTGRDRSSITRISRDEALLELAPNVLLTHAASSQAHLTALAMLTGSCPCYHLDAGTDLDELSHILLGLM